MAENHVDAAPTAGRRRHPVWKRMGIYLLIAVVVWALFVWFAQRSLVFPRFLLPTAAQSAPPTDSERWLLDTSAGQVEAWFLPGAGVDEDSPGPAVIFAHGNAELIDDWAVALQPYRDMGVSVLLPEYRGYGRSAGRPSQAAITADFLAFHDRLADRPEVDRKRIVFHGRSLGNGALASLTEHRTSAAWICESSFTSVAAIARGYLVPSFMVRDPFDVRSLLARYDGPTLILHGGRDAIIPVQHGERLHEAAANSRLIIYPGVGHNDPPPLTRYWQDIEGFLREAEIIRRKAP